MSWLESFRSFGRQNHVMAVGIGLAGAGIVSIMYSVLVLIRDNHIIPPKESGTRYITQDTEDALGLSTLEKLIEHPTYAVQEVAVKILCDRSVNSTYVLRRLLHGITRPSNDERTRCLQALGLLVGQNSGFEGISILHHPQAYSALVKSLEESLQAAGSPDLTVEHTWDEYPFRDTSEKGCLSLIQELCNNHDAHMLVKAKFVEKWLAKQNWGSSREDRISNFDSYMTMKSNKIVDILDRIRSSKSGLKALEKAQLIDKKTSKHIIQEQPEAIMQLEIALDDYERVEQVPRTREQSEEERRLRRQHREAIVLNDGTRPFGREDIIEREHTSPT